LRTDEEDYGVLGGVGVVGGDGDGGADEDDSEALHVEQVADSERDELSYNRSSTQGGGDVLGFGRRCAEGVEQ
jgi:hypothetical protein